MMAVKIRDMAPYQGFLTVDLRHVLGCLGSRALASEWRVHDVWATGEAASALADLKEQSAVSGPVLHDLANRVNQVIDGMFTGFDPGSTTAWVIIEAVDSTYYVVHSPDIGVIDSIRRTFRDVSDFDQTSS
jgi:hypothetical protein